MNTEIITNIIQYTVPAVVVAGVAYLFFQKLLEKQSQRDRFIISELTKPKEQNSTIDSKALKLQACERLVLFAERSDLKKLILRVQPISDNVLAYSHLLIQHIEQEFEYNITQQIYVSEALWNIVETTKNSTLQIIQQVAKLNQAENVEQFQKMLLDHSIILQKSTDVLVKGINEEAKYNLQ